ncbi:enoyl-CoA hydratase-related protein [Neptunomonas phycophila]|jgi:enoyl-CoA hydratase/carnithine racemase|uniref:Enoyl-CoA hydratase-related protein n=2 Tax=Neptunomonas phycophila TaxID=1572645 RepID=A0AAW7XIW1_9GAMM|nr:enoyl-CoA hydratase-related protein [Neptunomonas phycophila]MBT3144846.1 enoyl-CoA hydratase/isomerase family protein [Neptunomonas phycophila]MDO6454161.1 enoyl-CoA hydratase-related protein [Neptunomonas phycophila]MDO6785580.1 enoyl-CoA hydratase-related protein [Neptunomonas phycophila]MDP2523242.1 enoyl-CoA hydratase-related protein [Neptunomonas phycophila]
MAVHQALDNHILTLMIDRPAKRNALTIDMYQALIDGLEYAEQDDGIRAVIITGQVDCFSAGNDIPDFIAAASNPERAARPLEFLQTIANFTKPLVAAVAGDAVGIGTSMLLHCDLVYAKSDARFQLPFTKLALVPEGGTSLLMPRQLGHHLTYELLILGEPFSGERAAQLGLINGTVENPLAFAQQQADKLAKMPAESLKISKQMIKAPIQESLNKTLVDEVEQFKKRLTSQEAQAAFMAFMSKG